MESFLSYDSIDSLSFDGIERLAAEQTRLYELEQSRLRNAAEQQRIKTLEAAERNMILRIEKKLRLIGAFCTAEVELRPPLGVPVCVAVVTPSSLDKPIPTLTENVVLVGDSYGQIHVYTQRRDNIHLFTIALADNAQSPHNTPTALVRVAFHAFSST